MREIILSTNEDVFDLLTELGRLEIDEEKPISIKIDYFKNKRSIKQNNLFWAWMRLISNETGNSTKALHDYFCEEFLGRQVEIVNNKTIDVLRGTSGLNSTEMSNFMFQIEAFAQSELGITLPHPEDESWLNN